MGVTRGRNLKGARDDGDDRLVLKEMERDGLKLNDKLCQSSSLEHATGSNVCDLCNGDHGPRLLRAPPFHLLPQLCDQAVLDLGPKVRRVQVDLVGQLLLDWEAATL